MTAEDADEVIHRGIGWRRDAAGRISWHDEDAGRWVSWRPGDDAPPRPSGWEGEAPLSSGRRPKWGTPYRVVPVVLVAFAVVVGVTQALRSGSTSQVSDEAKAAEKLLDQCLVQNGTVGGLPAYRPKAVSCGAPGATLKVIQVLPGTPGGPSCPAGTTAVQLAYPGVRYPHIECTQPLTPAGR